MKKLLFAAAIATLGFSSVTAQEVEFGLKGGVNLANIAGDDVKDANMLTSFHVGAFADILVSEKFSVQPELVYSSQGTKSEESSSDITGDSSSKSTLKLNYINVPVIAKFYVADGLSIQAGPQVGFLTSVKFKEESTSNGVSSTNENDDKDAYNDIDFGLGLGLGYKLDNGIRFSARYNLGLNSTVKDVESVEIDVKNNVIQVSVGLSF